MGAAALDRLARSLRGGVLTPAAPGYEQARQVFNAGQAGRPALIVQCGDAADAQVAARFARDEQLPLAVRAGGHSIGGYGAASDALVVDVRRLDSVALDGEIVSVGGGCTWGRLLTRLEPHGLATPGAYDTRVGVAGLTLGGGYGILTRAHGLSCDNLVGADVVTADAGLVTTAAEPDLLWALRGAGANFGIVTGMRFRVHPVARLIAGVALYPLAGARDLLRATRDRMAGLPDATTVNVGLSMERPGLVALMGFHVGSADEARRRLAPLASLGSPVEAYFQEIGYRAAHAAGHDTFPEHHHNAWGADFVPGLDDGVLDAVAEHALSARGERMWVVIEHLGGAMARVPADATAFPHRDAGFGVVSTVKWQPGPGQDRPERALAIQAGLHEALRPFSLGRYVNYVGPGYGAADLAAAYRGNLPRLRELKRRWDPDNVFRHNVNVG